MPDVFAASALDILADATTDMRAAIEDLSPDQLNRKPGGDDSNSIAVLAVHSMTSTRWWLSIAVGAMPPARTRDDEFLATTPDAASLLVLTKRLHDDCTRLLDAADTLDWSFTGAHHPSATQREAQGSRAYALVHALSHLREHTGQMLLTRELIVGV